MIEMDDLRTMLLEAVAKAERDHAKLRAMIAEAAKYNSLSNLVLSEIKI